MEERSRMKIIYTVVGVVVFAILLNYVFSEFYSTSGNRIKRVYVGGNLVKAETVSSSEKITRGLAGRKELADGRGMLFVMSGEKQQDFWMKGMSFPIDIIWIMKGKVIGCERNISPEDARIFTSPGPASYVLEVPAGFCDSRGIEFNDEVKL
jgi:uncharacterized membrane protein (UPF0127 family)